MLTSEEFVDQSDVSLNIVSLNLDSLVFVMDERLNSLELCVL